MRCIMWRNDYVAPSNLRTFPRRHMPVQVAFDMREGEWRDKAQCPPCIPHQIGTFCEEHSIYLHLIEGLIKQRAKCCICEPLHIATHPFLAGRNNQVIRRG